MGAEERELLETVLASGETLLGVISDVLDFSKIEANKLDVNVVEFPIVAVLSSLLKPFEVRASRQGLAFTTDISSDVPTAVVGDKQRISQVLMNLVNNSAKFTERGSIRVAITAKPLPKDKPAPAHLASHLGTPSVLLCFTVTDTGIGIPLAQHSTVFRAFEQVDGSITRRHGGTGLGLAISRRLVELMGGEIGINYSVPGSGSEFTFTIPVGAVRFSEDNADPTLEAEWHGLKSAPILDPRTLQPDVDVRNATETPMLRKRKALNGSAAHDDSFDTKRPKPSEAQTPHRPLRILVAEDNPTNQLLISRLLTKAGHELRLASDGLGALEIYRGAEPDYFDVFLSDLQMPNMDGMQVMKRIRELEAACGGRRLPIVALTAHALDSDRDLCLASGFDAWLPKPLNRTQLFELLDQLASGTVASS